MFPGRPTLNTAASSSFTHGPGILLILQNHNNGHMMPLYPWSAASAPWIPTRAAQVRQSCVSVEMEA